MNETKRCGGIGRTGEGWGCEEEYPNHILPIDKFSSTNRGSCKVCRKIYDNIYNPYRNAVRLEARTNAGITQDELVAMSFEERKALMNRARVTMNVSPIKPKLKSEFGQSTPMTKRETVKIEGGAVPEGWVYIVQNPACMKPWSLKIGKTFPDGIPDIMSSARRFGRAELVDKFWFEEAYKAEQAIHALLNYCNLRTLGYTDCGMELFKCTTKEAIDAITKVQSEDDRPSIAVGG